MAWLYLFIASVLEIGGIFSLKYLSFKKIMAISWTTFFKSNDGLHTLLPLLGYIIFGVANICFFALAVKNISTSVAFAVWMALTLVGVKFIEVLFFKETFTLSQVICLALFLLGIMGLKKN